MADNVEIQGLEFEIVNDSSKAVEGLTSLVTTLNRLKTVANGSAGNLSKTAKGIRELTNALKGLNTGDASQKINRLATSLSALNNLSGFRSTTNSIVKLNSALAQLKWTDGDKLATLADGLRPLGELGRARLTSFTNQLAKLPAVVEELEKVDLDKFTRQMKDLAAAMKPFADEMAKVSAGFSAFPSKIQRLIASTDKYNAKMNNATKHTGLFGQVLGGVKFSAFIYGLRRIASLLGTAINESNEFQENMNLFEVAMGKGADEALRFGQTVSDILGIDLSDWIRNQGVFNTLLTGFGNTADRAEIMSKNLTQLGYDLSSFFNISVEDSMQKLQSGISGELEPLRRLGYDLSQARLEATALALGIDKSVASMTQAEKAELRYYAIMTQVTTAQGDLARTLEAPANQLRILQAQFSMAARAIGNIFIPALNAILPYAIAVVQVIREIANAIAALFGFKMTEVDYSGIESAGAGAGALADNLDDAAGAAKKLKSYTAGFDELNVFDPNKGGGGGAGAGAGGGNGFDFALPEYDFIGNAISTKVGEIKAMIEKVLADIGVICAGSLLAIGAILVVTGANIPLGVGLMAAGAVGLAAAIAVNWNGMSSQLASTLALITGVVAGFMLALGAIMAFSGANIPLGIALMAVGAVSLAAAAVVNWHSSDQHITDALTTITGILAGASLAVGAMLALTGVNTPLGIALMAIGAVAIASSVALNWNTLVNAVKNPMTQIALIVGTAMLGLGAILAFSGGSLPLGIALMAVGAASIVSAVALNWNGLSDQVKDTIALITATVSIALLAVGAILALSGVNIPLGLALLAGGALMMGTAIVPNWNNLSDSVKDKITMIATVVGASLLGVGAILALSGAALPLGLGLMALGALALGSAAVVNWDTVANAIRKTVSVITAILSGALIVLGTLLLLSGAGVGLGLAVLAAGLSLSYAAWTLDDNPITRFVRQMANSIIGLINGVIDAINDLFHIQFSGLTIAGITLIPAFDIRLVNIPHIPMFEDGGFPDEGQLFIAREAGAEMVGSIGRRTAVANNDQIVEGISAGVSVANDGVIAAIYALMSVVEDKDLSVSIGDEVIGRSYDRYERNRGVRVNNGAFANAY